MSKEPFEFSRPLTAVVIVASTRAARGIYEDRSGPIAVSWLREQGFETPDAIVVEDRAIGETFDTVFPEAKSQGTKL